MDDDKAYWTGREKYWHKKCRDEVEKELSALYRQSLDNIRLRIEALYGKFSVDNSLSIPEARRLLQGREFRQWRMSMEDYLEEIEKTGDKGLQRELNTLAMRTRIARWEKLYAETLVELDKLGRENVDKYRKFLTDAYEDNYYRNLYHAATRGTLMSPLAKLDPESVEKVLLTRWSGKNYSQRIWKNQRALAQSIKKEVFGSMLRGDSVARVSQRLEERFQVGMSNCTRLVRTELNYVHNRSNLDSIRASGMKYFRFIATLDRRTSARCRAKDGSVYKLEDAVVGDNVPPLHPNCRSTIAGSLYGASGSETGTRAARDENGKGIHVPANMKYEDWKAVYVDKKQSLSTWQENRKNDIIKEKIRQSALKHKVGFTEIYYPPVGIGTKMEDLAFDDDHINKARNHDVTREEAEKFIKEALVTVNRWRGTFYCYYGEEGVVYVDVNEKKIRTAFKKKQFDEKTKEFINEVISHVQPQ